jgi:NADPH:quinone reductase-like Zn-dependent oxidoreductase
MVYGVDPDRRPFGMPARAWAYDEPGSIGLLARRTKLYHRQLIPLPPGQARDVRPWAAFSGRYLAAWPNFWLAHATLRAIVNDSEYPAPFAWAWGGGVSLAQQELAQLSGYRATMIASTDRRLALIESKGMTAVDRRGFPDLAYDEKRFASDRAFRKTYLASERMFLATVAELTGGAGASLFFDHIGSPVTRATLKAMGCPGVLGTAGWKHGMRVSSVRALECMAWHTHVHTHCTRLRDVHASMAFAVTRNWLPAQLEPPRRFEEIPALAAEYARGLDTYFPLYEVNPS